MVRPGDMLQRFIKCNKSKRGKFTSPRRVLQVDTKEVTVAVLSRSGKMEVFAAVEVFRFASHENEVAGAIQNSIYDLNMNIVLCMEGQESAGHNEDTKSD